MESGGPCPWMRPQVEDLWDREVFRSRVRAIARKAAGRKIVVPSRRKEADLLLPHIAEFKQKAMEIVTAASRKERDGHKIGPDPEKIQKEEHVAKLPAKERDQIKANDLEKIQKAEGSLLHDTGLEHIKIDNLEGTQGKEFDVRSDRDGKAQLYAIADLEYHPFEGETTSCATLRTTIKKCRR